MAEHVESFSEVYGPLRHGGAPTVQRTADFDRLANLPRRTWQNDPRLPQLIETLNKYLHVNPAPCADPDRCEGCRMSAGLRPAQAAALQDGYGHKGAFLPIRPGGGKTAVSILLATVVRAKRYLLIVPADLLKKTEKAKIQLARHWRVLPNLEIVSYQFLAHKNNAEFLNEYKPDHVFADECDVLGKASNVAAKRLKKYRKLHPDTCFYLASGTVMGRQIREIAHLLTWALGDGAPMLRDWTEQIALGLAVDSKVPEDNRIPPGALLELPGAEGDTDLTKGRRAFRQRLVETPGVVSTTDDVPPIGLVVRSWEPAVPETLRAAILEMRKTWRTPAGDPFKFAIELYSHAKRMGLGFHYFMDPPPPPEWRFARSEWYSWAREKLGMMTRVDQLSQLQDAVLAGEVDDEGRYQRWLEIAPTYDPDKHRKVHWVDDQTSIGWAKEWVGDRKQGLIWTPDKAWGELAAARLGIPYFGEMGCDKDGNAIEDYAGAFAICSIAACGRGRNLQKWSKNLVVNPPSVGRLWTQLIYRTFRDGQKAAVVEVDVILTSRESYGAVIQAVRDSHFMEEASGGAQALVVAERHFPSVEELAMREDDLWRQEALGV